MVGNEYFKDDGTKKDRAKIPVFVFFYLFIRGNKKASEAFDESENML